MTETKPEAADPQASSSGAEESQSTAGQAQAPPKSATKSKSGTKRKRGATNRKSASNATAATAKFPRHAVERALRIPTAIYEQNGGKPASAADAVKFSGGSKLSGPWHVEISSAKKYGFLEANKKKQLELTDRARRAIAPQSENDRVDALREAVLDAPDLSEVYSYYRGENLPDQQFFNNALADRFGIPTDKVSEFITIFDESIRSAGLLDDSGPRQRLVDVGRDEQPGHAPALKPSPNVPATGSTCFVMQPFLPPLGGYYDSIYKPAIEQAGLIPLRADADIFGTGKIMDQIWRGISAADVLVAELTTKNPNVFYELGLAHALEKPVVLVSSNEEDVPFDLRHIRVIIYEQADPFWGQKLIDKLADNLRGAIDDPEEAIFRIEAA